MSIVQYPFSDNRLVIIDWASLSYHKIHSIRSRQKKGSLKPITTAEEELEVWRNSMAYSVLSLVKLFNPMDMIFTGEGTKIWRNDYVKEWYSEHAKVYFDSSSYWLQYDNFIYRFTKKPDGNISVEKMDCTKVDDLPGDPRPLSELPERVQKIFWDNVLPSYKGNRKGTDWPFNIDRHYWREYKETFAVEFADTIRATYIGHDKAEGDDVAYVGMNYLKEKYDDIILITKDGDWNQLIDGNRVRVFNHLSEEFAECVDTTEFLGVKVLAGDRGDNIAGIALPGRKTQLADAGARKLYATDDWHDKALSDGWEPQYLRNKKLIDLSYIPTDIQRTLCETIDNTKGKLCEYDAIYAMGLTQGNVNTISSMKELGYYVTLDKEYIQANPDTFRIQQTGDVLNDEDITLPFDKPSRTFGNFDGVFFDPTKSE
jgi:hypothetical protein